MSQFNIIGVIGHLNNEQAVYSIKRLLRYLESTNRRYVLESKTAALITDEHILNQVYQIVDMDGLSDVCDLVIVVGGDGSLLRGARALADSSVPLLGVNRGRLGFLTDVSPEDIEQKVGEVLAGRYITDPRFLLEMAVVRNGAIIATGDALNDVVLHPGQFIHMLEYELYVDDLFVTSQRADGMIICTPTGSTAYALSGGGPIMHPSLDAIGLVPMNPHTLSSRTMVVPGESRIRLVVGQHSDAEPLVSCDGQTHAPVKAGDEIRIQRKEQQFQLIHPLNHNFYERCRSKLGWGGHSL